MNMPINITSLGKLAGDLQHSVDSIRRTAKELGITAHRINGVPHYDSDDVERIASHIRGTEQQAAV